MTSFGNGLKTGSMNSTSVEDPTTELSDIRIFPNPFEGELTIKTTKPACPYQVYDIYGRCMYKGITQPGQTTIATDHWKSGVYLVKIGGKTVKAIKY